MIDHVSRLTGIVKAALREAAMGEAVGYHVSFGYWPQPDASGNVIGVGPAWFVFVSVRDGLSKDPIGNGFPIHGLLPPDQVFGDAVRGLLEKCRQDRSQKNQITMKGANLEGLIR